VVEFLVLILIGRVCWYWGLERRWLNAAGLLVLDWWTSYGAFVGGIVVFDVRAREGAGGIRGPGHLGGDYGVGVLGRTW
jgi:hypothetical protein